MLIRSELPKTNSQVSQSTSFKVSNQKMMLVWVSEAMAQFVVILEKEIAQFKVQPLFINTKTKKVVLS